MSKVDSVALGCNDDRLDGIVTTCGLCSVDSGESFFQAMPEKFGHWYLSCLSHRSIVMTLFVASLFSFDFFAMIMDLLLPFLPKRSFCAGYIFLTSHLLNRQQS